MSASQLWISPNTEIASRVLLQIITIFLVATPILTNPLLSLRLTLFSSIYQLSKILLKHIQQGSERSSTMELAFPATVESKGAN